MGKPNDGGPAFPGDVMSQTHEGMSLRDWFAGQALVSMTDLVADNETSWPNIAKYCYNAADTMLAEREKQ